PDLEGIVALPNVHEVAALTTEAKWQNLRALVSTALADYHRVHPLDPGMDLESLRSRLRVSVPPKLFRSVIEILETEKIVLRDESTIRLPAHEVRIEEDDAAVLLRLVNAISVGAFAPPDARRLSESLDLPAIRIKELLKILLERGDLVRVSGEIYFERDTLERASTLLKEHLAGQPEITVAEFRTAIGASRKYALALMDYFDQQALTIRVGDARRLR
ncbi:MAG: SelB C-terminal domain-containing protein, partial [bacterium]